VRAFKKSCLGAWITALIACPGAPSGALAQEGHPFRIVASAGVRGHLADARCDEDTSLSPAPFAQLAGEIAAALERVPLGFAFDAGGLLSPHGVARHGLAEAPARLAELVASLGYRALALGEDDLEAPLDDLAALARELRERGIPIVATNLVCADAARALCEGLVTAEDGVSLFHLGKLKLAFLAFTSPRALDHLAPEHAESLTLLPVEASLPRATKRARELGADVVIATIDDGVGAAAFGRALSIAAKLAPDERPDFIMSARGGSEVMFARPMTQEPPVIAAPIGGLAQIDLRHVGQRDALDFRARMLAPGEEPSPAVLAYLREIGPRFCASWGSALPSGALARPLDRDALLALVAGVARSATRADLIILPRDVVAQDFEPMRAGELTRADVEIGLLVDDPLVVADVDGKWLKALIKSADVEKTLLFPGLELKEKGKPGERVTLFDAVVDDEGVYRIVTTRPLERQGAPLPPNAKFRPAGHAVRTSVLVFLGEERAGDPREAVVDPASTLEWYGRFTADANFGGTVVRNPGGYEESQLDRRDTIAFGVTSQADFGGASRAFGWENRFDLRYRVIKDEVQGTVEGDDFLSLISRAKWLGMRAERPKVYVPEPFTELYVESEFTQGPTRDFHHLFVRPTVGSVFRLIDPVLFSVRVGFQFEALDPNRVVEPGLGFRLEAANLEILKEGETKLVLRGFVDYFWSSFGRRDTHTLRSTVDVAFTLGKRFGAGVLLVVFGLRDEGRAFSVATNATAFLRASFYGRTR
jgi:2',3'-cyclic-nucleotide 2'-phosphodiesterase (5'-nucleotidase family)